jgi:hypothetical protein
LNEGSVQRRRIQVLLRDRAKEAQVLLRERA